MVEYTPSNDLIDNSDSFQNGFECGQIWWQLKNDLRLYKYIFCTENSAQVHMFCEVLNIKCKIEQSDMDNKFSLLTTHGETKDPFEFFD